MRYALSNIAWKPHERAVIYDLMDEYDFKGLEIAPPLFLNGSQTPYEESDSLINGYKKEVEDKGLSFVSMQSLHFGASDILMFEGKEKRQALLDYSKKAIDFAEKLAIPSLVFGSPKNRIIPTEMSTNEAEKIAIAFFKHLSDYAYQKNIFIALEPNASAYGGNFITKTEEAIDFIKQVPTKGLKLNLDMGTMSLEDEDIFVIEKAMDYISHIHISEAFLKPIYEGKPDIHRQRAEVIKKLNYQGYVSIEMTAISEDDNKIHVQKALEFVRKNYG